METNERKQYRFGMVIDLDKCSGCGACTVACAVENNVAPAVPSTTTRNGLTWMNVTAVHSGAAYPDCETVFVPMSCQQCENETPCLTVCPQNAVDIDPVTGIVGQVPQRCLGCRYCMTACPYHARYFNWRDPEWTDGMTQQLNPDVAPRMRGVVEKCNFCHARLHAARQKAAANGSREIDPADYVPACVESCPASAITFGDLNNPSSPVAILAADKNSFRFLARLGTEPKVHYHSSKQWVREMAERSKTRTQQEAFHG
ncbi:MAG: 4Fe-4S dicluster domain-containing protein [Bacteroidetes bacterium]|nr:4Fe-4S dicluster domain-containing protein [Bacteroidota bacterium]